MASVMPPGLAGYLQADQLRQQSEGNQIGMLSRLQQMQAQRQQMQQQNQAAARDQEFRGALSALGPNPEQGALASLAARYSPAKDVLTSQTASLDRQANREAMFENRKMQIEANLETARQKGVDAENLKRMEIAGREHLTRLAAQLRPATQAPRPVEVRDPNTGEVTLYDSVTRKPWLPAGAQPPRPAQQAEPTTPASAISPDTEGHLGTGPSGFFGNMANTAAGAIGAPQPFSGVEKAVQALKNLQVQTITGMQESVPGRPSNFLMQKLEQLAVNPASLAMGDERAKMRLGQTRDMLKTEVERMERDVLAKPGLYKPNEVSKTRMSRDQLRGILREYDTMLGSFEPKEEKPQWSNEKESRYQELLRKRGN